MKVVSSECGLMPKILRIINRLNLGGPTYNAAYLTKYLSPEFQTVLLAGNKDESEASSEFIIRKLGLTPQYIPQMYRRINPLNDWDAYRYIKKFIQEFKPDIVHTHAAKAGALGRYAAYQCRVPVIIHTFHGHVFHSYFNPVKTKIFLEIEKYLADKSTKIIALSEKQKYELSSVYKVCNPEKIGVIPLGYDLTIFQKNQNEKRKKIRKKYQIEDDEIAIGIIGRLVPVKNHELFLKAIKYVTEHSSKKIRAFIVGDGKEREKIQKLANKMNLSCSDNNFNDKSVITLTSWIKDIDEVNAGMDIIALTSLNEGTPLSLIEAQAANKPIVATQVGGVEDIVEINKTALLSPNNNEKLFSNNLLRLIENEELRKQIGNNGYSFVKDKFDYQRLVADTVKLYNQLLQK